MTAKRPITDLIGLGPADLLTVAGAQTLFAPLGALAASSFGSLTGLPTDNASLAAALATKLPGTLTDGYATTTGAYGFSLPNPVTGVGAYLANDWTDLGYLGFNNGDGSVWGYIGQLNANDRIDIAGNRAYQFQQSPFVGTNLVYHAGNLTAATLGVTGTNTGDETYSTITSKLAGGSGGGTTNFLRADGTFAPPPAGGGGSVAWGSITGTLSSQTDLNTALSGKAATSHSHTQSDITGLSTALAAKEALVSTGTTAQYYRGDKSWQTLNAAAVGLANVNNTSDANKPVSSATQTALNLKANLSGATFTGAISATNLSGTNTGDETYSTITTKLAGGSGGGTANFLRADGTFAAPPGGGGAAWGSITGALTSQSDLVAALNGKVTTVATRSALAASASTLNVVYLREAGREGTFIWTAGNLSAKVSADTRQAIYVAPSSDTTGASGAWVREHDDFYSATWWGFVLNSSATGDKTNNRDALTALLSFLVADGLSEPTGNSPTAPKVQWPIGRIHLPVPASTAYYEINAPINWEGLLPSHLNYGGTGTTFVFDAGGFRFNPQNLRNGVVVSNSTTSAGSRFTNIRLTSEQARPSDANYAAQSRCGLLIHSQVELDNVFVNGFTRDGVAIVTSGSSDPLSYLPDGFSSNADLMIVKALSCFNNGRHGLFLDGVDSNACSLKSYNGYGNNNWDIYDSGFLANAPSDCHSLYNGMPSIGAGDKRDSLASVCTYGTDRYYVSPGQATAASTTQPGTNSAVWVKVIESQGSYSPDSQNPAWVSGMTWKEGGCYYTETFNSEIWINCYAESGQGGPYFKYHGGMVGGTYEPNPNSAGFFQMSAHAGPTIKATNLRIEGALWATSAASDGMLFVQSAAGNYYPRLAFFANGSGALYSGPSMFGHPDLLGIQSDTTTFYSKSAVTEFASLSSLGLDIKSGDLKFNGTTVPLKTTGASKLLGRGSSGSGVAQEITLGSGLTMTGTTLSATGGGGGGLSDGDKGDVVVGGSGTTLTVESATPSGGYFTITGNLLAQNATANRYQFRTIPDVWAGASWQFDTWDNIAGAQIQLDIGGQPINFRHNGTLVFKSLANGLQSQGVVQLASYTNASPADGQIWFDGTKLKKREGGVTSDLDTTGGGGGSWGSITGTLSSQTDLQTALDAKAPLSSPTFTTGITVGGALAPFIAIKSNTTASAGGGKLSFQDSAGTEYGYIGDLVNGSSWLMFQANAGIEINAASGVWLEHGGATKLNTTTTGVAVTGTLSATGAVSGSNLSGTNTGDVYGFTGSVPNVGVNGETIAVYKSAAAWTVAQANCSAECTVAATASTVYTLKKWTSGVATTVGTFTFAAGAFTATVSITSGSIASGQLVTIEGPATADATLQNAGFRVAQ